MNISQLNWVKNYTIPEKPDLHCVEKNVELLKFLDVKIDGREIPRTSLYLTEKESLRGAEIAATISGMKKIGIHAGTSTFKGHENRRWPIAKFIELINKHKDYAFFLFGAGDEVLVNEEIKKSAVDPERIIIVRDTTIGEAAGVIKNLDAFVTNDSGLMHVANAMDIPIVAILGPTNPNYISPWKVPSAVVRLNMPCSPCFYYSPRPLKCRLDGSFSCLQNLGVESVSDALELLLNSATT